MSDKSTYKPDYEPGTLNGLVTEDDLQKKWEQAGISNDFIFCKVMEDEDLLKEFIRMAVPELDFSNIEIQIQKRIETTIDAHGIRFDVFAKNENGDVVDLEMQVNMVDCLPKRMRYYESLNDSTILDKGLPYSELRKSYVIMVTLFDYYKKGLHKYTFTNTCMEDPSIEMGDETTKIVLNATGTADDIDEKMKAFLDYVAGKYSDDEYVRKLDRAVAKAKMNKEWRRDYMQFNLHDYDVEWRGMQKGLEQGREQGRELGRESLIIDMLKSGKTPDAISEFCSIPLEQVMDIQKNME